MPPDDLCLWGILGRLVGERAGDKVALIQAPRAGAGDRPPSLEALKALSAALPTYGGAPLFHLEGVTPEAGRWPAPGESIRIRPEELRAALEEEAAGRGGGRRRGAAGTGGADGAAGADVAAGADGAAGASLVQPLPEPDLVCLGCPHATLWELQQVCERIGDRRVRLPLWLCTSRPVEALARELGIAERLEGQGVTLLCDTCFVVAPIGGRFRCVATNSAKGVYYARGHGGLRTRLLSMEDCVEGAVTGRFP